LNRQSLKLAAFALTAAGIAACAPVSGTAVKSSSSPSSQKSFETTGVRQTDDAGKRLPFVTTFPNRWSSNNDGTPYEPCTAATPAVLAESGLDPTSASDAAKADFQTLRGCEWKFTDGNLASLSQYVGNGPSLEQYKKGREPFSEFLPDTSIDGRRALLQPLGRRMCTTIVQSRSAQVLTTVTIVSDPPPISSICDLALEFARETINQIPE
jgi:hypothetical protein